MKAAVKTREFKRDLDYDWEDYFPSDKTLVSEAGMLHRALEGADDSSRFVALLRPTTDVGVTLVVSVSTTRKDAVGRPIRTMSFLRAENSDEERLLASFFAEILRKKDAETLYDPKSGVAKAVESLYQTKKPDEFLAFCKSLKPDDGKGVAPENRCAFSRDNATERNLLADALPAAITGNSSFLFAITDRRWTVIRASLGSMFDRKTIRIFSKATTGKEPIPGGPPNTRAVAAAIGGTVLFTVLFAAVISGICSRRSGGCEAVCGGGQAVRETNVVNRPICSGIGATNAVSTSNSVFESNPISQKADSASEPLIQDADETSKAADEDAETAEEAAETAEEAAMAAEEAAEAADEAAEATDEDAEATDEDAEATDEAAMAAEEAAEAKDEVVAASDETDPSFIGGGGESDASTNHLERASGGKVLVTNAQASVGLDATNAIPTEERIVDPAPDIHQDGVSTNSAPAATETPTSLTNEADSSFIGGGGKSDASTNLLSRAIDGGVVATNAPASGGIGATDAIPAEGRVIESAGETRQDCVSSNAVPAEVETATTMTNQYLRLNQ